MSLLSRQRIRLRVNVTTRRIGIDVFTDATPKLLKPGDTQFEVTLFGDDASDLIDITHLDQMQLDVKLTDPRTGLSVMQKIVGSVDLNKSLTLEEWQGNAEDDCHAKFTFTAAETNVELDSDEVDYYLVISGLSDDVPALQIPFANGIVVVEESGAYSDPPAGVVEPLFYTAAQSDARYLLAADLTGKLNRSGDTMTGPLILDADPSDDLGAATKQYVDATVGAGAFVPLSGGTMTGLLTLSGAPSSGLHAATKTYVDTADALKLSLAGGTMTGALTLSGAPSSSLHAATKAYADLMVPLAGGTMTGALTLSGAPSSNLHAATKLYVDTAIANLVASSPAALDTLNELATALGNDANFASTMTTALAGKLALSGGTMTGALTLSGAPSSSLHAATKAYADLMVPLAGGTMTGLLTLSGAPSSSNHAATKAYADLKLALTGGTLSGALSFSGTGHLGLRTNNLTNSQAAALAISNGQIYYDTTLDKFIGVEGNTRKQLTASGGGTTWLAGSGDPDNGDGADGNYYLDEANGAIWRKTSGTWNLIIAERLPVSGGTLTGGVTFGNIDPALTFYGWSLREPTLNVLEFMQNSSVWFVMDATTTEFRSEQASFAVPTGYGYKVDGVKVVGDQQAANADTSGATLGQLETEVNELKAALRAHGLIAT